MNIITKHNKIKKYLHFIIIALAFMVIIGILLFAKPKNNENKQVQPAVENTKIETKNYDTEKASAISDVDNAEAKTDLLVQKFEESIKKDYNSRAIVKSNLFDFLGSPKHIIIGKYKIEVENNGDDNTSKLSIFKNNQLVITENNTNDRFYEICNLKLNNLDYYLFNSNSFGAHCCASWRVIIFKNGSILTGESLDLFHSGESFEKAYFFEKNGQLYFLIYDSSLAYFHSSFAGSVLFPVFYKIDSKSANSVMVNDEFTKYYQQLARDIDKEIEIDKASLATNPDMETWSSGSNSYPFELRLYPLVYRLVVNILARDNIEIAKKQFIEDSSIFFKDGIIDGEKAGDVASEIEDSVPHHQ